MDKQQAQNIIKDTFENPFDKDRFTSFIKNLLNRIDEGSFIYKGNYIPDAYKQYIKTLERIGKFSDGENSLDILVITLQKETSLERARTMQRNFIAWYLNGSRGGVMKDAALVAYVSPDQADWRFSLVKMDYKFEKTNTGRMKVKEEFTPARRWSFLVGANEKSHTAQSRLVNVLANDEQAPTLAELENAFDIETVTKEFFLKYRDLFLRTKEALDTVVRNDSKVKADFEANGVDTVNFAKKLLGQIVFLYFLQKKGWFGVGRDDDWGTGSKHFLRSLFDKKHSDYNNFFNDILESLFYEALRFDRTHDDHYYSRFNCKIPFLNGGLFDPIENYNWVRTDINLPNELFSNSCQTREGDSGDGILDVFDRYNFTVREDEPLEKEVAIDPELLGKTYEKFNAIRPDNFAEFTKVLKSGNKGEENKFNKKFGVYYTPREIVHYMCKQSLINYLYTQADETGLSDAIKKQDIEDLIEVGELITEHEATALIKQEKIRNGIQKSTEYTALLSDSIRENAESIDSWLEDITVCDPAAGSGAFPVGMMNEIVRARNVLSVFLNDRSAVPETAQAGKKRNDYEFKRRCIEHSLYGVDIDPGAVEIAKLRLWLSLVVDEEDIKNIKPLPNLDYKIICGNSLLGVEKDLFNNQLFDELEKLKPLFFKETNPSKKQEYKKQIDGLISQITKGHTEFDFEVYFSEVFHEKNGFDVVIANPPYFNISTISKDLYSYLAEHYRIIHTGYNDIVYYFIYLGIKFLRKNGCCSLITSNYYLGNDYAKKLRNYLKNHVSKIINFKDHLVFDGVSIHTCISFSHKEAKSSEVIFFEPAFEERITSSNIEAQLQSFSLKRTDLNYDWIIAGKSNAKIINKIKKNAINLGNVSTIKKGATSGNRVIFTVDKSFAEKCGFEKELLRTSINSKDIKRYALIDSAKYLIYIDDNVKIEDYPTVYKYLLKYKNQLSERNEVSKGIYPWYRLERPREKRIFDAKEKLVVPYRAESNKFAYDNRQAFNDGGGSYAIVVKEGERANIKYLLGILNSKLMNWFYGFIGKPKGKAREYFNRPLSLIPIKKISITQQQPFVVLVDKILAITKAEDYLQNPAKQAQVREYERQIDQMVYELYGLTEEEIKIVEGETK